MIISCRISTPADWLELNSGPYRLEASSFADEQTTWRRDDIDNPFVEGSWTVNALRENVVVPLSVWVRGAAEYDYATTTARGIETLKEMFSQRNFLLEFNEDGELYTYVCYVSDFTVSRTREFRHEGIAQFTAQVPRHPAYTLEDV